MMNELKRQQIMRRIEQQDVDEHHMPSPSLRDEVATQSNSLSQSETATRPAEKKGDLKKQSQFAPGEIGAKSFMKGDYEDIPACGVEENKANQSQLHAPTLAKRAEKEKNRSRQLIH